jgi:hypothetical protein
MEKEENKYQININKPAPTDQEINEHKNFNRVMQQYRRPGHRKMQPNFLQRINRYIPILILAIVVLVMIVLFKVVNENKSSGQTAPSPKIESPMQE